MECREFKKELGLWLKKTIEQENGKSIPARSLYEHASTCPECSAILKAALLLKDGKSLRKQPSPWLSRRIMSAISRQGVQSRSFTARWVLVPAVAALIFGVIFFFGPVRNKTLQNQDMAEVHLVLEAPGASQVAVVGDWNGWEPDKNRLSDPDGDGVWEITIKLQRGKEYRYQFLINGEKWIPDPHSPFQVEDGFGSKNSILHI